jgi:hypothetical protein
VHPTSGAGAGIEWRARHAQESRQLCHFYKLTSVRLLLRVEGARRTTNTRPRPAIHHKPAYQSRTVQLPYNKIHSCIKMTGPRESLQPEVSGQPSLPGRSPAIAAVAGAASLWGPHADRGQAGRQDGRQARQTHWWRPTTSHRPRPRP